MCATTKSWFIQREGLQPDYRYYLKTKGKALEDLERLRAAYPGEKFVLMCLVVSERVYKEDE